MRFGVALMIGSWEKFFENINNITLKLTPGCNLKCTYCNVEADGPKTPRMAIERFRQIADIIIKNSKHHFIGLEFHGGEPLLLPDEWFEEAVTYARMRGREHNKVISMPMVTNGTMLTDKRLKTILDLNIGLCVSCDGPPEINDELRGGGERLANALRRLQRQRVGKGVIVVLSQSNWNRMPQVMDWFDEIGVKDFMINFLQPQGRGIAGDLLTDEQMFHGMRDVFEHMHRTGMRVHDVEVSSRVERFVMGRDYPPPLACHEFQCQAGRSYIAIDTFGTVHPCGSDVVSHAFGHLDAPFDDARYEGMLDKLHDKGDWVLRCFNCSAKQICNHSCPTSDKNSEEFREQDCRATKLLWEYFCSNASKVQEVYRMYVQREGEFEQRRQKMREDKLAKRKANPEQIGGM